MAAAYEKAQRAGHPLLDGAAETVRACGGRFRLALLTNGPPDIQRLKLAQSGLESSFHAVAVSGESGVGKPAPEAFGLVLGALGVDAEEAIMVGDSWDRDVNGALSAGIRPIWVTQGRPLPQLNPNVEVISSISELVASLVQSKPGRSATLRGLQD